VIFLLDTTTFSDLMRGSPRAETYLSQVSPIDRVVVCAIVRGEIRYGIERLMPGKRRQELEAKAARLFDAIVCEPVPERAADQYARIKTAACAKGLPLDENDLWIAATALALGATLVTRDSDYADVDGLLLADWSR
jgi:predicted nucleic acid-binding protein